MPTNRGILGYRGTGGINTILDLRTPWKNHWFVDSTASGAGNTTKHGRHPDKPFSTVAYALTKAVSGDDCIHVGPGHTESISAAAGWQISATGVAIIGYGRGSTRPTITFATDTAADINVDVEGVLIQNILFTTSVDALVGPFDVNAADFTLLDCEFRDGSSTQVTDFMLADASADRLRVENFVYRGAVGAGTNAAFALTGCDDPVFRNVRFTGNFANAFIECRTTAVNRLRVRDLLGRNTNSNDIIIKDTVTGSTGEIGPDLFLSLQDNAANITEAITGATFRLFGPIKVVNNDGEIAMDINTTASTDA